MILKQRKLIYIILSLMFLTCFQNIVIADEECRKELSIYLKELGEGSNLYWSIELVGALGFGSNSGSESFTRDGIYTGLDWQIGGGFNIYFEGGLRYFDKDRSISSDDADNSSSIFIGTYRELSDSSYETGNGYGDGSSGGNGDGKKYSWEENFFSDYSSSLMFKLKEAFIQYTGEKLIAAAGIRTMTYGDSILLDERAAGLFAETSLGNIRLRFLGGSAVRDFSYGDKGWLKKSLYPGDLLISTFRPSERLGNTNFAGFSLIFNPGASITGSNKNETGESVYKKHQMEEDFQDNEFIPVSDTGFNPIERIGIIFSYEFGDEIGWGDNLGLGRLYYGLFSDLNIFNLMRVNLAAYLQNRTDSATLAYFISMETYLSLAGSGDLLIRGGYLGTSYIEGELDFAPGFTHLAKGEVLGFEPINAPLLMLEAEYEFSLISNLKIMASYYTQTEATQEGASEFDLMLRVPIWRGLRAYFIYSNVDTDALMEPVGYFGLETRFTF